MSESNRLSDPVGVIALDATEYPQEEHVTTIDVGLLKDSMELLETLGWDKIDVNIVPSHDEPEKNPMLMFRTPQDPFFASENTGVAIAPKVDSDDKEQNSK